MGFLNRLLNRPSQTDRARLLKTIDTSLPHFVHAMQRGSVHERLAAFVSMAIMARDVHEFVDQYNLRGLQSVMEEWALSKGDTEYRRWVARWFTDGRQVIWLAEQVAREGEAAVQGIYQFQEGLNAAGLTGSSYLDAKDQVERAQKRDAGAETDPVGEIVHALWPKGGKEVALLERIAKLGGTSIGLAALELLALRDFAFQVVVLGKFGKPPEETALGCRVYELIDSRFDNERLQNVYDTWVTVRSKSYMPPSKEAPEWTEWLRHIGAEFEQVFGKSGTALALIGASEFDSSFTRFQELCDVAAPEPP